LAELQNSLQLERERASKLEQDLATARRDVETQTALAAKAGEEASQLKKTADGSADLRKSLQQEHERASQLERDLAAGRHDVDEMSVLVMATAVAARVKQEAENGAGDLQKCLQREHARSDQLEQDLAAARRDAESKIALAAKASDEADQVKQAAERSVGELQKCLRQERNRRERLERNLASADQAKDAPVRPESITVGHTTQDKPPDSVAKPND
jgi:hypothetical protein